MFISHRDWHEHRFPFFLCTFIGLCLGVAQCKSNIGHETYLRQKVHLNGRSSVCFAMWTVSILLYLNAQGHNVHLNFFSFVSPVKSVSHIINTIKLVYPYTLYRLRYCTQGTRGCEVISDDITHTTNLSKCGRSLPPLPPPNQKVFNFMEVHRKWKNYDKYWIRSWTWFVLPSVWPLWCVLRLFLDLKNFWQMSHWCVFPSTWLSKWVFKSDCLLKPGKRKKCDKHENRITN